MQHFSYRLATAILALALLIIPVSAQAAPTHHSDTEARGASVWNTLQSWVDSTWDAVEIVLGLPTDDETTTFAYTPPTTLPELDTSTEAFDGMDPNG